MPSARGPTRRSGFTTRKSKTGNSTRFAGPRDSETAGSPMSNDFTELAACLACGGATLIPYLSLGDQPLANSFHNGSAEQPTYPLGLDYCPDCFNFQQNGSVNDVLHDPGY